jgi:anthranilate synthase
VRVVGGDLLASLPAEFTAARYHSLYATPDQVRGGFTVTALTTDPFAEPPSGSGPGEVVMAIEDNAAGRWAVQFHPESILTASGDAGRLVIANVLRLCRERAGANAARLDAASGRYVSVIF